MRPEWFLFFYVTIIFHFDNNSNVWESEKLNNSESMESKLC